MITHIGMIHNEKLDRWHPVMFRMSPLPGGSDIDRLKSNGHHTDGFMTRDEAIAHVESRLIPELPDVTFDREYVQPWDGESIPASVVFVVAGKLVAL